MKLDADHIKMSTRWMKSSLKETEESLERCKEDHDRQRRVQQCECRHCYYMRSVISGQAFTDYTCGNCGKVTSYHNTDTPRYCTSCASKHEACMRCGADLEVNPFSLVE